jgi:hypothetical protein
MGAALCALFATPGLAGEPAKVTTEPVTLSLTQMDKVTAGWGDFCKFCSNNNFTVQKADADAKSVFSFGGATAIAANVNVTDQEIN